MRKGLEGARSDEDGVRGEDDEATGGGWVGVPSVGLLPKQANKRRGTSGTLGIKRVFRSGIGLDHETTTCRTSYASQTLHMGLREP